jgi:hypothetical protein
VTAPRLSCASRRRTRSSRISSNGSAPSLCAYASAVSQQKARTPPGIRTPGPSATGLRNSTKSAAPVNLISPARLPLELIETVEAGFRRALSAAARRLRSHFAHTAGTLRRLGRRCTRGSARTQTAARIEFHQAADPVSELAAVRFGRNSGSQLIRIARLLVVTQDMPKRRGEIERVFLRFGRNEPRPRRPVSLSFRSAFRSAKSRLRAARACCCTGSPSRSRSTNSTGFSRPAKLPRRPAESLALTAFMRALRRKGPAAHTLDARGVPAPEARRGIAIRVGCAHNASPEPAFRNSRAARNLRSPGPSLAPQTARTRRLAWRVVRLPARISGSPPLAANRRRLCVARLRWPAHGVEGIPCGFSIAP